MAVLSPITPQLVLFSRFQCHEKDAGILWLVLITEMLVTSSPLDLRWGKEELQPWWYLPAGGSQYKGLFEL